MVPSEQFFGWVRFKIIVGTYLCRQSSLVFGSFFGFLEVFDLTTFGASLATFFFLLFGVSFWPFEAILGSESGSKTVLGPTYVDKQLWFWKYSSIFPFLIRPDLGPFHVFGPFGAIFGVGVRIKIFLTFLYRESTLVLEVQSYLVF